MLLRSSLLALSRQNWLRHWVETSRLTQSLTARFVAGQTLPDALTAAQRLNKEGVLVTLDFLGENVTSLDAARQSRDAYLAALREIGQRGLQSTVSIKLSQFGLDLSGAACRRNVDDVVSCARQIGSRVEIDMEASPSTDRTLAIVRDMHQRHGCVRAVIQAYLHRSEQDIRTLNAERLPIRLCKGAYQEPPAVAIQDKPGVDANYIRLTKLLLDEGTYPAIATHDDRMVEAALTYTGKQLTAADAFEFQMLYGIRRDLQERLTKEGYRLRSYVPYGNAWYPYFMRRLAERPANLMFLVKNLVRR